MKTQNNLDVIKQLPLDKILAETGLNKLSNI
jgi:Tat protein secretion system quality control protein TatD with DNase activity